MARGDTIRGLGYAALAVGFGVTAWELLSGGMGAADLDGVPLGELSLAQRKALADAPLVQGNHEVGNIDQRVRLLRQLLVKAAKSGPIHEIATEILAQRSADGGWAVPEKDCWAEVKFIFTAIRNPKASKYAVRYTRDSVMADIFTEAERTLLKTRGGDCDDYAVTVGGLLMSVGHPVKIRVIQTEGEESWNHVYLITPKDWDGEKWMAIDVSMDKPVGWEAPGAAEVAATGKPAGIVLKVKDYDVSA